MESKTIVAMQSLSAGRRPYILLLSLCLCVLIINSIRRLPDSEYLQLDKVRLAKSHQTQSKPLSPRESAANETLGFHKVLALSPKPSWRTRGLEAAASLTGLSINIPVQPQNPPELVEAFRGIRVDGSDKHPSEGSARAWVAHLDLLKFVIAAEYETALILEDDVDWDIRLKSQMQLISDNVRAFTDTPDDDTTPFGLDWDVLWLGHCGSLIDDGMIPPPISYRDETRCETELYSGWSKRFIREKIEEGHRLVQTAGSTTVCTFGYGVTKKSVMKLLDLLGKGAGMAYDLQLQDLCREKKLRCLLVNPQVFNHYEPPASEGDQSLVHAGDRADSTGSENDFEFKQGSTGNIMKSARCQALFGSTCMRPPSDI
ncbi:glycosyltransferase family 25 protein [Xylariaceae sp. FL1019]|nr:glycosyltransferase family 25 protein [Xylariaceae sp. FL1019]